MRVERGLLGAALAACGSSEAAPAAQLAPSASGTPVVASAAVEAPAEPPLPPEALFVDAPEKAFKRRARAAQGAELHLTADPDAHAVGRLSSALDEELLVVEAGPARVRLLLRNGGVSLAAYVDTKHLLEAVVTRTVASPRNGSLRDGALFLLPGFTPTWKELRGTGDSKERAFVHRDGTALEVEGWAREAHLGRVFTPEPERDGTHYVEGVSQLLDAPGGAPFAKIDVGGFWGFALGEPKAGFQKIAAVHRSHVRLEGWVPSSKVTPGDGPLFGTGGFSGWGSSAAITLDAGTKLYASSTGPQVGLLTASESLLDENEHANGRGRVGAQLATWGFVTAWAPDEAFEAAKAQVAASLRREKRVTVSAVVGAPGYGDPTWQLGRARGDVGACVEAAEQGKKPLTGKLDVALQLDANGATKSLDVKGPLAKDASLVACLKKDLRPYFGTQAGASPQGGTVGATLTVLPP